MKKIQITSSKCGECHGPYALGVKCGDMIFTTQIGSDITGEMVAGGIKEQTKQLLENAKTVIEAGGSTMDNVVKVTIYISDMALVPEMNEVYKQYFPEGDYPARCCTQTSGMVDDCIVEMEFVAFVE